MPVHIEQSTILANSKIFLEEMGESISRREKGICAGLVPLRMQAQRLNEKDKFFQRLRFIASSDTKALKRMAKLLKKYKEYFQKESQEQSEYLESKLRTLKIKLKTAKEEKDVIQKQIDDIKRNHFRQIEIKSNKMVAGLSQQDHKLLGFAKEYYAFINAALLPYSVVKMGLTYEEKMQEEKLVELSNIPFILNLLQSTDPDKQFAIKESFSFYFIFKDEKELGDVLSKSIKEGDYIAIGSPDHHVMFITKIKDEFVLYDPNNPSGDETFESGEKLAAQVSKNLFADFNIKSELSIGFRIYEDADKKPEPRFNKKEFIEKVYSERGASINTNADWKGRSALSIAVMGHDVDTVTELLERKVESASADSALHDAVAEGYTDLMELFVKYNFKLDVQSDSELSLAGHAALVDNPHVLDMLIKYGLDLHNASINKMLFLRAAEKGSPRTLDYLIKRNSIHVCSANGESLLELAAKNGHAESAVLILNKLLSRELKTSDKIENMFTAAVSSAIKNKQYETVKALMRYKEFNKNAPDKAGKTFLHTAVETKDFQLVKLLMEYKVDYNLRDKLGFTPIELANQNKDPVLIDYFQKIIFSDEKSISYPLNIAVRYGFESQVSKFFDEALLEKFDYTGNTPLHYAAQSKSSDIIQKFFSKNVNINILNSKGEMPLHLAFKSKSLNAIGILLDMKANIHAADDQGKTPLDYLDEDSMHLAYSRKLNVKDFLLKSSVINIDKVDENGKTLLDLAIKEKDMDLIRLLISKQANIQSVLDKMQFEEYPIELVKLFIEANPSSRVDATKLYDFFINNSYFDLALKLLENPKLSVDLSWNVESRMDMARYSLATAISDKQFDLVNKLLALNIDVNAGHRAHATPLALVVNRGHADILSLLIQKGVDVNKKISKSNTALHVAAINGDLEIVKLLLSANADITAKNNDDLTPLECAKNDDMRALLAFKMIDEDILDWLKSQIAKLDLPVGLAKTISESFDEKLANNTKFYNAIECLKEKYTKNTADASAPVCTKGMFSLGVEKLRNLESNIRVLLAIVNNNFARDKHESDLTLKENCFDPVPESKAYVIAKRALN